MEEKDLDKRNDLENGDLEEPVSGEEASEEENPQQDAALEEDAAQDAEPNEKKGKKKTLLGKEKKPNKLQEKVDELEDRVKRQMAEFDNFRKRSEKEKAAMFETGAKSVVEKILPVVDNFERGLAGLSEEEDRKSVV